VEVTEAVAGCLVSLAQAPQVSACTQHQVANVYPSTHRRSSKQALDSLLKRTSLAHVVSWIDDGARAARCPNNEALLACVDRMVQEVITHAAELAEPAASMVLLLRACYAADQRTPEARLNKAVKALTQGTTSSAGVAWDVLARYVGVCYIIV